MQFLIKDENEKLNKGKITKPEYISNAYKLHDILYGYSEYLENTNISNIEISDRQVVFTTRDCGIKLVGKRYDERLVPIETLNFEEYEGEEMRFLVKLLKMINAKSMFDIGGNIGYVSLYLTSRLSGLKSNAFEPLPDTYEMLIKNIEINNCDSVLAHNVGISDENKDTVFYSYIEGCGNSSMKNLSEKENVKEVNCQLVRLDVYIDKLDYDGLDFIKCDVEGAEFSVLKGGINTIRKYKPAIYIELLRKWSKAFGYHPNDVVEYLKNEGYRCFVISGDRLKATDSITDETIETNFCFLHNEKHSDVIGSLSI